MHELSIAMSLAELVEEQLAAEPDATVTAVDIRIGTQSSVVPEALQFAWEPVSRGTRLARIRTAHRAISQHGRAGIGGD